MDGLELAVHEAALDERRRRSPIVEEALKVAHRLIHVIDGGRHVRRLGQARAHRTDPVPRTPELPRLLLLAAHPREQAPVDLPDQAQRKRQLLDEPQTVIHRCHVVDRLGDVAGRLGRAGPRLEREQVVERRLRPFDLRAGHGFLVDEHGDEQVGVGQRRGDAVEAAEAVRRLVSSASSLSAGFGDT